MTSTVPFAPGMNGQPVAFARVKNSVADAG
jgi:hypothetical protein